MTRLVSGTSPTLSGTCCWLSDATSGTAVSQHAAGTLMQKSGTLRSLPNSLKTNNLTAPTSWQRNFGEIGQARFGRIDWRFAARPGHTSPCAPFLAPLFPPTVELRLALLLDVEADRSRVPRHRRSSGYEVLERCAQGESLFVVGYHGTLLHTTPRGEDRPRCVLNFQHRPTPPHFVGWIPSRRRQNSKSAQNCLVLAGFQVWSRRGQQRSWAMNLLRLRKLPHGVG